MTETWGKDYADGYSVVAPLFSGAEIPGVCCNFSLVGASPQFLLRARYPITHVPSVNNRINRCEGLVGTARPTCWADFDRYLMEKVVPVVPLQFFNRVDVLGPRVQCYSFDQFTGAVALDHLCLQPTSGGTP